MSLDAEILTALRAAKTGVSGADLAHRLGVSRAAVWARIEELRLLGYDISASPHIGYHLNSTPDVLHADDLRSRLPDVKVVGRDIRVFQETTSTNDVIEKLARDGVKEGVVVFAECQSRGRGRLGRKWVSPPRKGLWFSILLRPDLESQAATQVTVAVATALARAIAAQTHLRTDIKWPNDILVGGRKVAGILTELAAEVDHVKYVVVGIGINVNLGAADLPAEVRKTATSLRIETGAMVNRAQLAAAILRELDVDYRQICAGDFESIASQWQQRCATLGHDVSIRIGERVLRGRAESLDETGALLLRTEHGRLERITGGDVTLEK